MLIALQVGYEVISGLRLVVAELRRQDSNLADQVRRAASSAALNTAEGNKRAGKDRAYFFRIAAGSCDEVRAALNVGRRWGYLDAIDLHALDELLDRQAALLYRLNHRR
jgi:four helix bundle protein